MHTWVHICAHAHVRWTQRDTGQVPMSSIVRYGKVLDWSAERMLVTRHRSACVRGGGGAGAVMCMRMWKQTSRQGGPEVRSCQQQPRLCAKVAASCLAAHLRWQGFPDFFVSSVKLEQFQNPFARTCVPICGRLRSGFPIIFLPFSRPTHFEIHNRKLEGTSWRSNCR